MSAALGMLLIAAIDYDGVLFVLACAIVGWLFGEAW